MSTNRKSFQLPAGFWSFFWAFLGFAWVSTSLAYAANLDSFSTATNVVLLPDGNMPARSEVFVSQLISNANATNRSLLLWNVYPASIRGRVFNENTRANPMETGMGMGAGW